MTRNEAEEIKAVLDIANRITMEPIEEGTDATLVRVARVTLRLWDGMAHYENMITWDCSCQRCAALLNSCYAADRRAERAEAALAAALARR